MISWNMIFMVTCWEERSEWANILLDGINQEWIVIQAELKKNIMSWWKVRCSFIKPPDCCRQNLPLKDSCTAGTDLRVWDSTPQSVWLWASGRQAGSTGQGSARFTTFSSPFRLLRAVGVPRIEEVLQGIVLSAFSGIFCSDNRLHRTYITALAKLAMHPVEPWVKKIHTFINMFGANLPSRQNFHWVFSTNGQLCKKFWHMFGMNGWLKG